MPKSKQNYKRKMKLRKQDQKREKWVQKKLAAYNALPEDAKQGLLQRWSFAKKKAEEPIGQLGGVSLPVEEED